MADLAGQRYFGMVPRFDPEQGVTVREPEGKGFGFWAGGHSVCFDPESGRFYMFYRVRRPRGQGRGGACRVAESEDGVKFTDIWEGTKEQLDASSIEVATIIRDPTTGKWRLYVSYEPTSGQDWRVDLVEAEHPSKFDLVHHRTVIVPQHFGFASAKDPRVYVIAGLYHAFVCCDGGNPPKTDEESTVHPGGGDCTVLLTSEDGIYWRDLKVVFEPGKGAQGEWGHHRARINSVIRVDPVWVAFFDGGEGPYDGCDEYCGIAISHDLEHWRRVSRNGPWVTGKYGGVRYVEALRLGDEICFYYEYPRADASRELRMSKARL
jgi:hypothetical protein